MSQWQLEYARLDWALGDTPVATDFNDVYFSKHDGLAEGRYVFLEGNDLPERFQQLALHSEQQHFTIAETGFGTGLNFLQTLKLWFDTPSLAEHHRLVFLSTELHPLHPDDLRQALAHWPQLKHFADALVAQYPKPIKGLHTLQLDFSAHYPNSHPVTLILGLDDAESVFDRLIQNHHPLFAHSPQYCVDAWFLDGFAPSKNHSLWQDSLFEKMAKLSHRQTTLATFTAAGFVRRALQANGFSMQKRKGFGKKREMLTGLYYGLPITSPYTHSRYNINKLSKAWGPFWSVPKASAIHNYTNNSNDTHNSCDVEIAIIGAGIAGLTSAYHLAQAGFKVAIFDANTCAMSEASGNPQAVLFPKLSVQESLFSRFNIDSLQYSLRFYQQLQTQTQTLLFEDCGVLQLLETNEHNQGTKLSKAFSQLCELLDAYQATACAQTRLEHKALYYKDLGYLLPQAIAAHIIQTSNISFYPSHRLSQLSLITPQSNVANAPSWQLSFEHGAEITARHVVMCCAHQSDALLSQIKGPDAQNDLSPDKHKTLDFAFNAKTIRGQITDISEAQHSPARLICHKGYISPRHNNHLHCGASFELDYSADFKQLSPASTHYNLSTLAKYVPDVAQSLSLDTPEENRAGRANLRYAANDYMPIAGRLPNPASFKTHYANLWKNAYAFIPEHGEYLPNLYTLTALGSRGFISAPYCAMLLESMISGTVTPAPQSQLQALSPARFIIQALEQKQYAPGKSADKKKSDSSC